MFLNVIKCEDDLIDAVYEKDGCILYGCGKVGRMLKTNLDYLCYNAKQNKNLIFTVTDEEHKPFVLIEGEPIYTITEAVEKYPDYPVLLATVDQRNGEMKSKCENLNVDYYIIDIRYFSKRIKYELINELQGSINRLIDDVERIKRKISMQDDVWQIGNVKFYVPNYPMDYVQRTIVETQDFFESAILKKLEEFLAEKMVIFDIGSNIGNHSIYWAKKMRAEKIYAFEPVLSTYKILQRNIEINGLNDVILPLNIGLSDTDGNADFLSYSLESVGSTSLVQSGDGEMAVRRLDSLPFLDELDKVDFVKIDVEGFEHQVLQGGKTFFHKFRPAVMIESFPDKFAQTDAILKSYGYAPVYQFDYINYLYTFTNDSPI